MTQTRLTAVPSETKRNLMSSRFFGLGFLSRLFFSFDPLQMNASRLRALVSLLPPANSATNRRRVGKSFRHFIPPLLLSSRPDLFFAAVHASKRSIDVITSLHEIGSSIAVIWREQRFVNGYQSAGRWGAFDGFRDDRVLELKFLSSRRNFLAPLFAAFHRILDSPRSGYSALQLGQSTAAVWVSLPRRYEYSVLPGPILKIAWRRSSSLAIFLLPIESTTSPT
jgi:hypothetical protein